MYQSQHFLSLSLYLVGLTLTIVAAVIGGPGHAVDASIPSYRELGHFVGFMGLTSLSYVYAQACHHKAVFRALVSIHLVLFITVFLHVMPAPLADLIVTVSLIFAGYAVLTYYISVIKTHQHFVWTALIGMMFLSLYWEGIHQPFLDVYGGPPRGYIQ